MGWRAGEAVTGEHWYGHWKRAEAAERRRLEEQRRRGVQSRIALPHWHSVDIVGLWEETDGVEQKVGHWAKCAFEGCGWSAQPHTGDDLDAAWAAAKADRDEHLREVLRARRLER